jgi:hypothetical protein
VAVILPLPASALERTGSSEGPDSGYEEDKMTGCEIYFKTYHFTENVTNTSRHVIRRKYEVGFEVLTAVSTHRPDDGGSKDL